MIDNNIFRLVDEYAKLCGQSVSLYGTDHIRNAESLSELLENSRGLSGVREGELRKLTYQLLSWSRYKCELDSQFKRVSACLKELTGLREQRLSHNKYINEIEAYVLSVSPESDTDLLFYMDGGYSRDEWIQDGLILYGGCESEKYKVYMKAVTKLNYHNKLILSLKQFIAGLENEMATSTNLL